MINREIPFGPRLEGDFRVRFYNAALLATIMLFHAEPMKGLW